MKIEIEKFLTLTAMLATGVMPGCVVADGDGDSDPQSSEDAGEPEPTSEPSADGEEEEEDAGKKTEMETEGTDADTSGEDECFGGDIGADVDCEALPYAGADCGAEYPMGVEVCLGAKMGIRKEAAEALVDCLADIDAEDPCGDEHTGGVVACYQKLQPMVCDSPEAQEWCEEFTAGCDDLDVDTCASGIAGLNSYGLAGFSACMGQAGEEASCTQAFVSCQLAILPF